MNKLFTKIAALSVGLAMAVGVGVAVGQKSAKVAKAADTALLTFDFEEESAHRTSGTNSYSATPNVYVENGINISLTYADSVTTGTPLQGNANITGRVSKNKTDTLPSMIFGPMDLSSAFVSGFSYDIKSVTSLTVKSSYSLDGSTYTQTESYSGPSSKTAKGVSNLEINEPSSFYLKFEISITSGASTTGNRDTQIDSVQIIGHSTSSEHLKEISCDSQSVSVASQLNLANQIVFDPADAVNKTLSYEVKSGSELIELSEDGVITGVKSGDALITVTPEDTEGGAQPIDVAVTVNAIDEPDITVGDQYVMYSVDSKNSYKGELSGLASSLGTVKAFTGDVPSCEYVLDTEEGYFENTVAFKNGSTYLALKSASNNIHSETAVNSFSSWIVLEGEESGTYVIKSAAFPLRSIQFNYNGGSARFACYVNGGQTAISLYHYVEKALEDFSIESEIDVYISGTRTIAVEYDPADASDKELTWVSANEGVATVDENGVVTGVAVGETIVTASKTIQGVLVERTCTVNVLNNVAAHHGTSADPFDVADAVQVAKGVFTKDPDGNPISLENSYYVEGMITLCNQRTKSQLTFWIGDDASQTSAATGGLQVYRAASVYGIALASAYATDDDVKIDFNRENYVKVYSTLMDYNGTPETSQNVADIVYCDYIEARKYAETFNSAFEAEGVCDSEGESTVSVLAGVWSTQAGLFDALDEHAQAILTGATAKETSNKAVEKCAAKYDYIGGKYQTQLGAEYDFMSRNPSPVGNAYRGLSVSMEDNNMTIIIVVIAATSAIALSVLLLLKKRKQK